MTSDLVKAMATLAIGLGAIYGIQKAGEKLRQKRATRTVAPVRKPVPAKVVTVEGKTFSFGENDLVSIRNSSFDCALSAQEIADRAIKNAQSQSRK